MASTDKEVKNFLEKVKNTVCFITGCSTGFGQELAKHIPEPVSA